MASSRKPEWLPEKTISVTPAASWKPSSKAVMVRKRKARRGQYQFECRANWRTGNVDEWGPGKNDSREAADSDR